MSGITFFAVAFAAFAIAPVLRRTAPQIDPHLGVAPDCPYGYYEYAPHNCAPDGYYGPEWFHGGVFIGTGPWFIGSEDFQGLVDNALDPRYGYRGALPKVGDKPAAQRRAVELFNGNEVRDGQSAIHGEDRAAKPSLTHFRPLPKGERLSFPGWR